MTKCFVEDDIDQSLMMPPSLHDWLPENHLAQFIAGLATLPWLIASYDMARVQRGLQPLNGLEIASWGRHLYTMDPITQMALRVIAGTKTIRRKR